MWIWILFQLNRLSFLCRDSTSTRIEIKIFKLIVHKVKIFKWIFLNYISVAFKVLFYIKDADDWNQNHRKYIVFPTVIPLKLNIFYCISSNYLIIILCFRTKANFLSKSPYQKWITVRKFNMFLLKLSGSHVMLPEWKCSIRFMTPGLVIANMFTLMVYTIFYYRNDLMMALQATVIIALVIPVSYFQKMSFTHRIISWILYIFSVFGLLHSWGDTILSWNV